MESIETITAGGGRRGVEVFLRDELLESLPSDYDRRALITAKRATYVIHQDVSYTYTKPVRELRQRLVVLPRNRHLDQQRLAHRFTVRCTGTSDVQRRTDRFGNSVVRVHVPVVRERIDFVARSVISRSVGSPSPVQWIVTEPAMTRLTSPDDAIGDAVAGLRGSSDVTGTADAVCDLVRTSFEYRHDVTSVRTTAAEAWQLREGVCQDMAHVMIAMCTTLGISARYVSGHMVGDGASHAWVEVLDPRRGTVVAIDPTHNRRTDLRYITTATGRDYLDVAPTTGTYNSGGGRGHLSVRKTIRLASID